MPAFMKIEEAILFFYSIDIIQYMATLSNAKVMQLSKKVMNVFVPSTAKSGQTQHIKIGTTCPVITLME